MSKGVSSNIESQCVMLSSERLFMRGIDQDLHFDILNLDDHNSLSILGLDDLDQLNKQRMRAASGLSGVNETFFYFQLFEKEKGKRIGTCGLSAIHSIHQRAELYYLIEPEYRRLGYAKEAVSAVSSFALQSLRIAKLFALVFVDHDISIRVLESANFLRETTLKKHGVDDGILKDVFVYSRINQ